MTENHSDTTRLPDDVTFYKTPLSPEVQAAIGRFITCFAAIESMLPMQVARVVAIDAKGGEIIFSHAVFTKTYIVSTGTPLRALIAQICNLMPAAGVRSALTDEVRKTGEKLLKRQERRNDVAHMLSGAGARNDRFTLRYLSASKSRIWAEKSYTVAELDAWCEECVRYARRIDEIVSEFTGWSWKRIKASEPQWLLCQSESNENGAHKARPTQ